MPNRHESLLDGSRSRHRLIGESPAFLRTMDAVSEIAPLEKPVLVVGERGTGKEGVAERIHYLSGRWEGTFLKLNCAAITETLLESELFGHESGAFTGATRAHQGRFERADGGTLFLDELAAASMLVQEKILRVIEYGEFERLGGSRTLTTDIRLIAATNEDLPDLARQGRFREDLLDRLAFDVITLPPLRARQDDIPILATQFAVGMATELGRDLFPGFTAHAMERLLAHPWPGNIRELKNVVERAVYRCQDPEAEVDEVTFDPFDSPWRPGVSQRPGDAKPQQPETRPASHDAGPLRPDLPLDFREHIQDYEIDLLQHALEANQFNQKRTAEQLGLTYHQLRGYLRKYPLLNKPERA
ncbi:MAG: phage shock protein operon transcriptional activator [Gammaproteobacteria bacterium]|nr:MAG: phage shock protein operon transcriptional activator [Gammaproteobacteria bacterium]